MRVRNVHDVSRSKKKLRLESCIEARESPAGSRAHVSLTISRYTRDLLFKVYKHG